MGVQVVSITESSERLRPPSPMLVVSSRLRRAVASSPMKSEME